MIEYLGLTQYFRTDMGFQTPITSLNEWDKHIEVWTLRFPRPWELTLEEVHQQLHDAGYGSLCKPEDKLSHEHAIHKHEPLVYEMHRGDLPPCPCSCHSRKGDHQ